MKDINPDTWMQDMKEGKFCMVCGEYVPQNDPEGSLCRNRYTIPHGEIWERMKICFMLQEVVHGKTDYTPSEIKQISARARSLIWRDG